MNDIDKIKAKIKKLLALSRSPNPNEAASALRMAQELMAEYKIEKSDIGTIEISEETVSTTNRENPPLYENNLFLDIEKAFGCECIYSFRGQKRCWRFIGLRHRAQIAAYIGQVLLRKLRAARAGYLKSLYRVRSAYKKTQRADDFCYAWVSTVTDKLPAFAGVSEEEQKAISVYKNKNYPDLTRVDPISRKSHSAIDYYYGANAGKGVELQHGVGVHSQSPLFLGT